MEPGEAPLTRDETRAVQVAILAQVDAFCHERGIAYYLWAGTLLGAVRHGGYIPWDDDIDIAMPRPGYERFCREFSAADTGPYQLFSRDSHPAYAYPFARVSDVRTRLVEGSRAAVATGLNIDVFPMDGWPVRWLTIRLHRLRMQALHRFVAIWTSRLRPADAWQRRMKNVAIRIKRPLVDRIPIRWLTGMITAAARTNSYDAGHEVGVTVFRYLEKVDRRAYGEPVDIQFEGRHFRAGPNDHDAILRGLYGDYLTLPTEAEQASRYKHFAAAYRLPDRSSA